MGNIASIHIEKGHLGEFFHNDRSKETKNSIFKDGEVIYTLSAKEAIALYKKDLEEKSKKYTERTGQKLQKKAITLLSAVVNIKEDTTLDDLKQLGQELEKKLGTKIYQIAIHRDEGHINENGEKKVNEHAHILCSGLDEEGRSVRRKLTKSMLRELQDLAAQTLGMERGKSVKQTKRKRLDTYQYKEAMKFRNADVKEIKKELNKKDQEVKELKSKLEDKEKEIEEIKVTKKQLEEQIKQLREEMKKLNSKLQEKEFTQEDYKALSAIKKQLKASNLQEIKEKLESFESEIKQRIKNRQKALINKYSEEKGLLGREEVINKETALKIVNTACKSENISIVKILEENEKLKEENKQLRKENQELRNTIEKMKDKFTELKQVANKIIKAKIGYYKKLYEATRAELVQYYKKEQKLYTALNNREKRVEKEVEREVGINPNKKVKINLDF